MLGPRSEGTRWQWPDGLRSVQAMAVAAMRRIGSVYFMV